MAHHEQQDAQRDRGQDRNPDQDQDPDQDQGEAVREEPPPPAEWAVAAVGLVLLVLALGYLSWHALTEPRSPPHPVIELVAVEQQQQRYVARLRVANRGRMAAARVAVVGRLQQQAATVEESATELDYLPGESAQEAALTFARDPRQFQLELYARSWQKP